MADILYSELEHNPSLTGLAEMVPDISYSTQYPELKMTMLKPQSIRVAKDGQRFPAILFIQGRGWTNPYIYYELPQLCHFAQQGYIMAAVTHHSSVDGYRASAIFSEVKTAIRFLREKAEQFCIDPERIGIWGSSSGGNFALLAGLTADCPAYRTAEYPEQSDGVQTVIDCFGAAEVTDSLHQRWLKAKEDPTDLEGKRRYFGLLGESEEEQWKNLALINPIEMIEDKPYPPFLIMHGDADSTIPYEQSKRMAHKLHEHRVPVELVRVKGAEHERDFWSPAVFAHILDFIRKTL